MKSRLTILICCAGPRCQLVQCFREAGRQLALELRVIASDPEPELSPACQMVDASYRTPEADQPGFVSELLKICRKERVALLLPTVDPGLLELSKSRAKFEKTGTRVVISAPSVVQLARDKLETARVLQRGGIVVPHTVSLGDFMSDSEQLTWPVIAKPLAGTSSVGLIKPRTRDELRPLGNESYVVQEVWRGREFTVNVFWDRNGRMRCIIPHWRLQVRTGVVVKARTERVPALQKAAAKLAKLLPDARGPLCFQAMVNDAGDAAVFELNARIGGGYPLADRAGATFARWLVEEAAGIPSTANDNWEEGLTMLCYDSAVFLRS